MSFFLFLTLFIADHTLPRPPPLLTEVCHPSKHVVMMRPDLLAPSLLAEHQAVSLAWAATNLSDYISLSWEVL